MKKKILYLFACLFSFLCFSQKYVDLARFHYSNTTQNKFDTTETSTNVEDFGLNVTLPIQLNDSNVILTGFNIDQTKAKLYPFNKSQTLSTINLKLGFNRKYGKKWSGTYMLLPKITSDLKELTSKDFQFGALGLMKYTKKENLKYSVGLYYNGEFFGPFIVPLLGLYYKSKNEKLEVNLTLPVWADINYKLNKFVNIGTSFAAFVRSYHLSKEDNYVVKKSNNLFAYLQFNLTKSILLQTKVGYTIGRSYQVYNRDDKADFGFSAFRLGDDRTPLNPTFKDGLVFKIRLIYRFHLE